jgi:[ribosomal protein S5]-alanine N-acetyltransferase
VTAKAARLQAPAKAHASAFLAAVKRSRRLHGRWVKPPSTPGEYAGYVRRQRRRSHRSYLVFTPEGAIAGVININEIVRGAFCSGYLGYYAFVPHHGQGYMSDGLCQVIERAFSRLALHRLEANVQPGNTASRRLVERLGFRLEGYSERYLKIAGRWRDHERWALTLEDWASTRRARRATGRRARSARARSSSRNPRP